MFADREPRAGPPELLKREGVAQGEEIDRPFFVGALQEEEIEPGNDLLGLGQEPPVGGGQVEIGTAGTGTESVGNGDSSPREAPADGGGSVAIDSN